MKEQEEAIELINSTCLNIIFHRVEVAGVVGPDIATKGT